MAREKERAPQIALPVRLQIVALLAFHVYDHAGNDVSSRTWGREEETFYPQQGTLTIQVGGQTLHALPTRDSAPIKVDFAAGRPIPARRLTRAPGTLRSFRMPPQLERTSCKLARSPQPMK